MFRAFLPLRHFAPPQILNISRDGNTVKSNRDDQSDASGERKTEACALAVCGEERIFSLRYPANDFLSLKVGFLLPAERMAKTQMVARTLRSRLTNK